ncbi:MAG: hypothetical protein OXU34_04925, partial [Gammaproteobacteria bacterium]|nr:hypothetical protein [Gammaproteobacteria bacterium]
PLPAMRARRQRTQKRPPEGGLYGAGNAAQSALATLIAAIFKTLHNQRNNHRSDECYGNHQRKD